MAYEYDYIGRVLPEHIEFITSQELEDRYPDLTPKQREYEIVKLHGGSIDAVNGEDSIIFTVTLPLS
mgnify:FL=1